VPTEAIDCPGGGTCLTDPDVQSCPICNPATLVCNGGPRNNLSCVPDSAATAGPQFPVSHDCPSAPGRRLGELPIGFSLTTGTMVQTAVPSASQERVFCGYCRDANTSGTFQGPPAVACTTSSECAEPFEACEQGHDGAFAASLVDRIVEVGSPAATLADGAAHASTLVSVFCVPPTYNGILDTAGDLPGPGAVGLSGTLQLVR
jgi:hypothetical protein